MSGAALLLMVDSPLSGLQTMVDKKTLVVHLRLEDLSIHRTSQFEPNSEGQGEPQGESAPEHNHNGRDRRNSTRINQSEDELMDRVYNLYGAPLDYRQRSAQAPPPSYHTHNGDEPNCSFIPPYGNSMYQPSNSGPIWQFRGPEFKLSPFSGASEDYQE